MVQKFTKALYELIVEKELGLKESLEIIGSDYKKNHFILENLNDIGKIKRTGKFLYEEILKGSTLSNSMKRCPFMNFDEIYIDFIKFAEMTGQLGETLDFLNKRCERRKNTKFKLFEVGIYPSIVFLLAGVGSLYLCFTKFIQVNKNIFISFGFLLFICFFVFIGMKRILSENKLYEAFLAMGFLVKGGININDAVTCGARIIGISTKKGQVFQTAGEKLLLGMDLESAFSLGEKYSNAFFFADKSGGKADVFEKVAKYIGEKDSKRKSICYSLIEPIFILITGIYFIILVVNIYMPYISQMNLI